MGEGGELRCVACGSPISGAEGELCASCRPGSPEPLIGTTVGLYRIDALAGRGGMGEVYRAWHTRLDRPVALKVLTREKLADRVRRQRFLREARSASSLAHPNIVTVHDLIEVGERDYLVMEWVEGPTLAESIPPGGLPLARALRYALQIAAALRAAHEARIVHRDVKPANVLIADGDVAKLTDFGLAKLSASGGAEPEGGSTAPTSTQLTRQGARVGTADYMSPEQALGGPVDPRSDIFSLGAVLYEMMTGRRPFAGPSRVAVMHNVVYKEPKSLHRLAPGTPPELRRLIARALAKLPEDRYASMAELEADLEAISRSREIGGDRRPSGRPGTRGRALAAAGFALLLAVAAILIPGIGEVARDAGRSIADRWSRLGRTESPEPLDAYALYRKGEAHLERYDREGQIDAALDAFQRAIGQREDYAAAYSGLASALRRKAFATKDPVLLEQAERRARQALELEPELLEAEINLALVLIDLGQLDEAGARLERVARLDPGSAAAYRGLGDLAVARGEPDRAVERYRRAIELAPGDRELHGLLGSAYYRAARYAEAADAYRRRVELAPDDVLGRKNLAAALHMLGDYEGAIRELQEAVKVRPEWSVYNNLGTLYFFQGLYPESVRAFESALERGAQSYLVWANLGDACRWSPGNEERAASAYLRAIQLVRKELERSPDDATRRSRLALFLAKRGELAEARATAESLAAGTSADSQTLYRLATVWEIADERQRAIELLERSFRQGYSMSEFERDPELAKLRSSVAGQTMLARVDQALAEPDSNP